MDRWGSMFIVELLMLWFKAAPFQSFLPQWYIEDGKDDWLCNVADLVSQTHTQTQRWSLFLIQTRALINWYVGRVGGSEMWRESQMETCCNTERSNKTMTDLVKLCQWLHHAFSGFSQQSFLNILSCSLSVTMETSIRWPIWWVGNQDLYV